jgi:hypothetical protein
MGVMHMKDDDTYRISVSDFTDMAISFVLESGYSKNRTTARYLESQSKPLRDAIRKNLVDDTIIISDDVLSSLKGVHRRSISFQPEILSAFDVRSDYVFSLLRNISSSTIPHDFIVHQFKDVPGKMESMKLVSFKADFRTLDIILNYPYIAKILKYNVFIMNGLSHLYDAWEKDDGGEYHHIGILDAMSSDIRSEGFDYAIKNVACILRYGTDKHDMESTFEKVVSNHISLNDEYAYVPHVCDVNAAALLETHHDHRSALKEIRHHTYRGYISWYSLMDIAVKHDTELMDILLMMDKAGGIYHDDEDGEYPDWMVNYIRNSYKRFACMKIPASCITKERLHDCESLPHEFIYENIAMDMENPWKDPEPWISRIFFPNL